MKGNDEMKHRKGLAVVLLCCGMALGGCGSKKPAVETDVVLGEETKGSEIVVIENETEITFTGVEMKLLSEKNFGSSILKENEKFENGKTASLYVPEPAKTEDGQKAEEKEPVSLRFYDEKTVWQFDDFEYFDVKDKAVLTKDSEDLILTYQSVKTDQEVTVRGLPDSVSILNEEKKDESTDQEDQDGSQTPADEAVPAENDLPDESISSDENASSSGSQSGQSGKTDGSQSGSQQSSQSGREPENDTPSEDDPDQPVFEEPVFDPPVTEDPRG